jgi:ATP-dependent DNA ligase
MNIAPVIPIRRREAFDHPAFLFELKYDGFRALADTVNGRMLFKKYQPNAAV